MDHAPRNRRVFCSAVFTWLSLGGITYAQTEFYLRDVCRLKGQEENTLSGFGLVVGLKGTGDGSSMKPTTRALARAMQLMGGQVASDLQGQLIDKELENAKNVAMVFVTATIPPAGAQAGEKLSCTVSALGAKSLEGGMLMQTALVGPRADRPQVYAIAQGPITIDNLRLPTTGRIAAGCKMEANVETQFVLNNTITLVLEPGHASFNLAQDIEDLINSRAEELASGGKSNGSSRTTTSGSRRDSIELATAIDQAHILVNIPGIYVERPVQFIDTLLSLPLVVGNNNRSVVIREREGVIVIGEDVTIAPLAISHKNFTISTKTNNATNSGFVGVGFEKGLSAGDRTTLKELVKALNTLDVPTEDKIAIIKAIDRQGNLYGDLILE
jgi:flagellar P-ring protein precursor FlgI